MNDNADFIQKKNYNLNFFIAALRFSKLCRFFIAKIRFKTFSQQKGNDVYGIYMKSDDKEIKKIKNRRWG